MKSQALLPVALPACRSLRHGSRAPILRGAILTKLTAAIAPEQIERISFRAALAVLDTDHRSSVVTRTANQGLRTSAVHAGIEGSVDSRAWLRYIQTCATEGLVRPYS